MKTHDDRSHPEMALLRALEKRGAEMTDKKENLITAGAITEAPISEWDSGGVYVRKMPDDKHNILRLSIGGGSSVLHLDYLVFRGDRVKCIALLERALQALRGDDNG